MQSFGGEKRFTRITAAREVLTLKQQELVSSDSGQLHSATNYYFHTT
jgi:hypothetical protein